MADTIKPMAGKPASVGTPTPDGGLYLDPGERRWLNELIGRIELFHVRRPIEVLGRQTATQAGEFRHAAASQACADLGLHIAHEHATLEFGVEGDPHRDPEVARAHVYLIRHGIPPLVEPSYRAKQDNLAFAETARQTAWRPPGWNPLRY